MTHPAGKDSTNLQSYNAAILRLAYAVVLLLASLVGVMMVDQLVSGSLYGSLVGLLYLAAYVLVVPVLGRLVLGKPVRRPLALVAKGLLSLLGAVLALTVIGSILDIAGVSCAMGTCGDTLLHAVTTLLIAPYIFLPLVLLSMGLLVKGWHDHLKDRQTKP